MASSISPKLIIIPIVILLALGFFLNLIVAPFAEEGINPATQNNTFITLFSSTLTVTENLLTDNILIPDAIETIFSNVIDAIEQQVVYISYMPNALINIFNIVMIISLVSIIVFIIQVIQGFIP